MGQRDLDDSDGFLLDLWLQSGGEGWGQRKGQLLAFALELLGKAGVTAVGADTRALYGLGTIIPSLECRRQVMKWLLSNELSGKLLNTIMVRE